ncbi:uncharacterized protein BDR25DRAFT_307634, partial [Lindgomyces ingoldianus]
MRRNRKPRHRKPCRTLSISRPSFPLFDLPLDLQVCVLAFLDTHTLQDAIASSWHIRELFLMFPERLLRDTVGVMGSQVQNLTLTTFSIIRSIEFDIALGPGPDSVGEYLAGNLDTEKSQRILQKG